MVALRERVHAEALKWTAFREPVVLAGLGVALSLVWALAYSAHFSARGVGETFWGGTARGFTDFGLLSLILAGGAFIIGDHHRDGGYPDALKAMPGVRPFIAVKLLVAGLFGASFALLAGAVATVGAHLALRGAVGPFDPIQVPRMMLAGLLAASIGVTLGVVLHHERLLVVFVTLGWVFVIEKILGALHPLIAAATGPNAADQITSFLTPIRSLAWFVTENSLGVTRGFSSVIGVLPTVALLLVLGTIAMMQAARRTRQ